jgi:hypothetical protein
LMSESTPFDAWINALIEFDTAGYNTKALRDKDPRPLAAEAPSSGDCNAQNSKKRLRLKWSSIFGWWGKK